METITVNVTWKHINTPIDWNEIPDGQTCMLAMAILDAGFQTADVGFSDTSINGEEVIMPKPLALLMREYDQGRSAGLTPFSFDVYMVNDLPVALSHPYWIKQSWFTVEQLTHKEKIC